MIRKLAVLLALLLASPAAAETVTDMAGRRVALPAKVDRVACLEVLCYQKMLMLGAADRITEMTMTTAPWMIVTNPKVVDIPKITADPSFEDLLAQKVDVVFFSYNAQQTIGKLASLGIPGLVSQPMTRKVATAEGFIEENKRAVRLFGQVLGGEAVRRAEEWCAYVDARVARITAVTAAIPAEQRLKVYYLRGPQALTTQGIGTATYWFGALAGAEMVVKEQPWQNKGPVSMEDIIRWNPDVILVGRQYSADLVLKDERWAGISAVRHDRVFPTPEGAFYWDGGLESVLLMEFIAKRAYPDRFPDLDLAAELRDFYARFYRYPLSADEAELLLQGRSPDGSRRNAMNN
jgi:iron complex transport system substrate-binding protein